MGACTPRVACLSLLPILGVARGMSLFFLLNSIGNQVPAMVYVRFLIAWEVCVVPENRLDPAFS